MIGPNGGSSYVEKKLLLGFSDSNQYVKKYANNNTRLLHHQEERKGNSIQVLGAQDCNRGSQDDEDFCAEEQPSARLWPEESRRGQADS